MDSLGLEKIQKRTISYEVLVSTIPLLHNVTKVFATEHPSLCEFSNIYFDCDDTKDDIKLVSEFMYNEYMNDEPIARISKVSDYMPDYAYDISDILNDQRCSEATVFDDLRNKSLLSTCLADRLVPVYSMIHDKLSNAPVVEWPSRLSFITGTNVTGAYISDLRNYPHVYTNYGKRAAFPIFLRIMKDRKIVQGIERYLNIELLELT